MWKLRLQSICVQAQSSEPKKRACLKVCKDCNPMLGIYFRPLGADNVSEVR